MSSNEQTLRGHWVTCSPEWIKAGGNCATAPRILCGQGQGVSHMHPAHQPHADPAEVEQLLAELAVTKKLYAEASQASYDFGAMQLQIEALRAQLADESAEHRTTQVSRDTWRSNYHEAMEKLAENAEGLMLKAGAPKCATPRGLECPGDGVSECKACPGAPNPYWPAESAEELARFKEWMKTNGRKP